MRKPSRGVVVPLLLAGAAVGTGLAASAGDRATDEGPCDTVFVVAHQDDELLSMGAAISNAAVAGSGNNVCVALFTTGVSSTAKAVLRGDTLAGTTYTGWVPATTGSGTNTSDTTDATQPLSFPEMTDAEFVAARDREFVDSLTALGVRERNVFVNGFVIDGEDHPAVTPNVIPGVERVPDNSAPSPEQQTHAQTFMDTVLDFFGPAAHYRSHSPTDPSPDHAALGSALRTTSQPTASKRYYYPPYQVDQRTTDAGGPSEERAAAMHGLAEERASNEAALQAAARAYGVFAPADGRYGIGWLSVPQAFGGEALTIQKCREPVRSETRCEATPPFPEEGLNRSLTGHYVSLWHE